MPKLPKKPGKAGKGAAKEETPAGLLKEAEAAIETGERRQRAGELDKAVPYFSTALATLERGGLVDDRQGCLLFASATSSLVEVRQAERRIAAFDEPLAASQQRADADAELLRQRAHALRGAAEALERGHAAAEAAGAGAEELGHFCVARAQAAEMLREVLSDAGGAPALREALTWAAAAAKLWGAAAEHEQNREQLAEPDPETVSAHAGALLACGALVLRHAPADKEAERSKARAKVAQALETFGAAVALCDTAKGDDVPEVLLEWAQAFWDAAGVAADAAEAAALLESAVGKARDSLALMAAPTLESLNLLGDILRAAAEHAWREGGAAAAGALYSRAFEAYASARRIRANDLRTRCNLADGWLDCARMQIEAAAGGAGAAEQELAGGLEAMQLDGAAAEEPPPPPPPPPAEALRQAVAEYRALLSEPAAAWAAAGMSAEERADVAFNLACACALGGREAEAAQQLLAMEAQGLLLRRAEVADDSDLAPLLQTEPIQALLERLPA